MKKGDVVNIWTQWGISQETIKSIGSKYITTDRYRFNKKTLIEVDGCGYSAYIIADLEKFYKEQEREKAIILIRRFNYDKLTLEDAIKIQEILKKYK